MDARQVFESYERRAGLENYFRFCPRCATTLELKQSDERVRPHCPACGYVQYLNPGPGVAILIVDGERFLLGRRTARSFRGGLWCLPCGFVEYDEDFLTAARREALEETGLEVELISLLSLTSNFLAPRVHSFVAVLLARPLGGEAKGGDDVDLVRWFKYGEDLPEMAFPADAHIIERYFSTDIPGAAIDPRFAGGSRG